jgi:small conductance mechanosensitive channel
MVNLLDPQTIQGLAEEGITMVTTHGLNILVAILIFMIGRMICGKVAKMMSSVMVRAKVDDTLNDFLHNIVYYALLAAVVVMALGQAGINVTSFLAVLGAAGLAVGLALKDSLGNFAAGVMLIMMKFFKKGDYVTVGGESGTVTAINIFNTVLTTPDNMQIVIPNSSVLNGNITNVTANDTRRVDMMFGIGYGDDMLKAKQLLERILAEEPRILAEPKPVIEVLELGTSSVNIICRPWTRTSDYWGVYFAVTEKVKLVFDSENISFPYPQTDVHLYKAAG